jgi:hypothetical protein
MSSFDPILRVANKEIEHILKKYNIGGTVILSSRTHSEYCFHVPDWSLFQIMKGSNRGVLKIRTEDMEQLTSTMHFILSTRDICDMMSKMLNDVGRTAGNHINIEHVSISDRRRDD